MFIKKIFEDSVDLSVHLQFQKFSKGNFKNRAMIKASNSKGKYSISTTAEYANEFVRTLAEKIMNNKIHVSGAVITTLDLTGKLDFKDKKQFMGVKQYIMDSDLSGNEILDLCNTFPLAFMALSFKFGNYELKIKAKAPKSAKPSTKGESTPKIDFCKLITTDKNLIKNLLFDINLDSFKKVEITHEFVINDLILPKNETDFAKIREMAKRKGKIIRKINLDGKEIVKEKEFEA
jgi:hypothetical protein